MKQSRTYELAVCAIFAALMCILGPMSIPIGPVPISFTNLVIYLAVYVLGKKRATISYLVYLLLGCFGLPVFSGFTGGFAKLAGPTGGYLIGFIFMAWICGWGMEKTKGQIVLTGIGMITGTAVAYLFGTVWFVLMMHCGVVYALGICVIPFIPFDLIKIVIASVLGKALYRALFKAKLLPFRKDEIK